jgi:hypothetical protein
MNEVLSGMVLFFLKDFFEAGISLSGEAVRILA